MFGQEGGMTAAQMGMAMRPEHRAASPPERPMLVVQTEVLLDMCGSLNAKANDLIELSHKLAPPQEPAAQDKLRGNLTGQSSATLVDGLARLQNDMQEVAEKLSQTIRHLSRLI